MGNGENLHDIEIGKDFLNRAQKVQTIIEKKKEDQVDFIKTQNFPLKNSIKKI